MSPGIRKCAQWAGPPAPSQTEPYPESARSGPGEGGGGMDSQLRLSWSGTAVEPEPEATSAFRLQAAPGPLAAQHMHRDATVCAGFPAHYMTMVHLSPPLPPISSSPPLLRLLQLPKDPNLLFGFGPSAVLSPLLRISLMLGSSSSGKVAVITTVKPAIVPKGMDLVCSHGLWSRVVRGQGGGGHLCRRGRGRIGTCSSSCQCPPAHVVHALCLLLWLALSCACCYCAQL